MVVLSAIALLRSRVHSGDRRPVKGGLAAREVRGKGHRLRGHAAGASNARGRYRAFTVGNRAGVCWGTTDPAPGRTTTEEQTDVLSRAVTYTDHGGERHGYALVLRFSPWVSGAPFRRSRHIPDGVSPSVAAASVGPIAPLSGLPGPSHERRAGRRRTHPDLRNGALVSLQ